MALSAPRRRRRYYITWPVSIPMAGTPVLAGVQSDIFKCPHAIRDAEHYRADGTCQHMRMLNVGGGNKGIPVPSHYVGWEHILLDIDPSGSPDIVCDARNLTSLAAAQFDAIYCSHNLEHYYKQDGRRVLRGFLHVLRDDGFAEIRVPDVGALMQHVIKSGIDIEDVLGTSPMGPITPRDILYGPGVEIERSGQDFYAHKTGFTEKSLYHALEDAGFEEAVLVKVPEIFELRVFAFKATSRLDQLALLGIPPETR